MGRRRRRYVQRRPEATHVAVGPAAGGRRRGRAFDERQEQMTIELVGHVGRIEVDVHEAAESVVVDRLRHTAAVSVINSTTRLEIPAY